MYGLRPESYQLCDGAQPALGVPWRIRHASAKSKIEERINNQRRSARHPPSLPYVLGSADYRNRDTVFAQAERQRKHIVCSGLSRFEDGNVRLKSSSLTLGGSADGRVS